MLRSRNSIPLWVHDFDQNHGAFRLRWYHYDGVLDLPFTLVFETFFISVHSSYSSPRLIAWRFLADSTHLIETFYSSSDKFLSLVKDLLYPAVFLYIL